jgi:hypothetical protein
MTHKELPVRRSSPKQRLIFDGKTD